MFQFNITNKDKGFTLILKREFNIILKSIKDENDINFKVKNYQDILEVATAIDNTNPECDEDIKRIMSTLNTIYKVGILSPITFSKDEFLDIKDEDIITNIRNNNISYNKITHKYHYNNLFKCYIKAAYNHNDKKQVAVTNFENFHPTRVYLSKGGVITGEYFKNNGIFKDNTIKNKYYIESYLFPVSTILNDTKGIYVVDHREPVVKHIKNQFELPILIDDIVKARKFNIRNYNKL